MLVVRYVALAALVVWLGAMIVLPLLVQPAVPDADFTEVERRFHFLASACGATILLALVVMKFVGPPPHAFLPRASIVVLMLMLALYSGVRLGWELPVAVMTVNTGLGLVLLFWYVRE